MPACTNCNNPFEISKEDTTLYSKIIPDLPGPFPRFCPSCREQRRLAIRNERNMYKRTSDLSGQSIISSISPDKPYKVYSKEEWWSDSWSADKYAREFDFSRPFFDQFNELMIDVPKMNLCIWQSENCDYCMYTDFSRNCYLVLGGSACEDSMYSNLVDKCKDCVDLTSCKNCEIGYDSIDCLKCNNFFCCIKCENSNDIRFCFDCKDVKDCVGCYNLRHMQYCIFNEQYTKEDYFKKLYEMDFANRKVYDEMKELFIKLMTEKGFHRGAKVIASENCTGDNLTNSKNSQFCFESDKLQDCKYTLFSSNCKDCYDIIGSSSKGGELCAESMSIEGQNIFAGYYIAGYSNIYYCDSVFACKDIFGCVGVKNKQYCILNKQYTRDEYTRLLSKIIDHMKSTGEWGEFFPIKYSIYAYNETVANDFYPLTKEEALKKGYKWKDQNPKGSLPSEVLCSNCQENFKIIAQERTFLTDKKLPMPSHCPDCRYKERFALRNPRKLFNRLCTKCSAPIKSVYSTDRIEKVYCDKCYLE